MNENSREPRASTEGLIKIGELAKQTDTNITTLKYYIREGLIRPVVKTGRNMSWYDPACIETVRMIHMLQKERYYPISVIRDLLDTDTLRRPPEMALLDAIHKVDDSTDPRVLTTDDAVRLSGLDRHQIATLSEAGLISAARKRQREAFTEEDLSVMKLVKRRMDAGIPLDQSIAALRIYDRAVRNAAQDDIDSFVELIMQPDFTAEAGAHMIRVSDQTLDEFVALKRKEYNRNYGKSYVGKLYRFLDQCAGVPAKLEKVYRKCALKRAASICADAAKGILPEDEDIAIYLRMFLGSEAGQKSDLIAKINACQKSREFFSNDGKCQDSRELSGTGAADPTGSDNADPEMRVLKDSLRCLWLTMAPEALQCGERAEEAAEALLATLQEFNTEKGEAIYRHIMSVRS